VTSQELGEYTFEPNDKQTKVKFRFNVKTYNPLATFLAPFVNIAKAHSEVTQQGFKPTTVT
jgi:hypothetical protein